MDVSAELDALLSRKGITQAELAEDAGVSQSTVSRARQRPPERKSKSYARLCNYIQQERETFSLPGSVHDALAEIWDGSPAQAEALAALIRAAGDLTRAGGTGDSPSP